MNITLESAIKTRKFVIMNFNLTQIPERTQHPRTNGLTMVLDKGLSIQEADNLCSAASPYIDIVKFGFGTSLKSNDAS